MVEASKNEPISPCDQHGEISAILGFSSTPFAYALYDLPSNVSSEIFNKKKPRNFLIAGLDPNRRYSSDYETFIRRVHNNRRDNIVYVSSNFDSLQKTPQDKKSVRNRRHSAIESVKPGFEIDIVFANHSLPTLSEERLKAFSYNTGRFMTPGGLLMITKVSYELETHLAQIHPVFTINPRTTEQFVSVFPGFTPIVQRTRNPEANVIILQKK